MEWKEWIGKKIFVKLKCGDVYNGKIISIDDENPSIIWITLIDKFDKEITIVHSEIIKIEVERK